MLVRAGTSGARAMLPRAAVKAEGPTIEPPLLDARKRSPVASERIVKQNVSIEIAGARYRMTTDADPAHLERLAGMVNARVAELGPKAARTASPMQLLVVVALGLAEELERSEERRATLEDATRKAVGRALARIDERLGRLEADDHGSKG